MTDRDNRDFVKFVSFFGHKIDILVAIDLKFNYVMKFKPNNHTKNVPSKNIVFWPFYCHLNAKIGTHGQYGQARFGP